MPNLGEGNKFSTAKDHLIYIYIKSEVLNKRLKAMLNYKM
jgi:hypothetical protein